MDSISAPWLMSTICLRAPKSKDSNPYTITLIRKNVFVGVVLKLMTTICLRTPKRKNKTPYIITIIITLLSKIFFLGAGFLKQVVDDLAK